MEHVLIATLGDSPVVVSAMFDLLTKREKLPISKVIVIRTQGDSRDDGYLMILEALAKQCMVDECELAFEDPCTEDDCFTFLMRLFGLLNEETSNGNHVYLSLAGGRKNMSALMGLAAPFYKCIQKLYHVIDKDEKTFQEMRELRKLVQLEDKTDFQKAMHPDPDLEQLKLVSIPLENSLHVKEPYLQTLATMNADKLQKRWDESPEKADDDLFMLRLAPDAEPLLKVFLTDKAKEEYQNIMRTAANRVQEINNCLRALHIAGLLRGHNNIEHIEKSVPPSYVYNKGHTAERPFFHTEPGNITTPKATVDKVVVKRFARHDGETQYDPSRKVLAATQYGQGETLHPLSEVLKGAELEAKRKIPSILIVPMGTRPMIATQLYMLLKDREQRVIHKVVLVYPANADSVYNSVQLVKNAFDNENSRNEDSKDEDSKDEDSKDIDCEEYAIAKLEDVSSTEDCVTYQESLERLIERQKSKFLPEHPDGRIDLALSGGRKGMAVLALFAAQRTQLHEVYHTLIANKQLERDIEFDLDRSKGKDLYDKLFLRAYEEHKDDFRLFRVPIGPLHS